MAGTAQFKLDKDGIGELLKSDAMTDMVAAAAADIADQTRGNLPPGIEVTVESYVTDRAAASVAIADPNGMTYQAENGALTKASTAVGADVTGKQ